MQKWMILLFFFFIGMSFLPVKLAVRLLREPNEIKVTMRVSIGIVSFRINWIDPLTKAVWSLSTNRFWEKKPPADLAMKRVRWKRLFLRLNYLNRIFIPVLRHSERLFKKAAGPIKISRLQLVTEFGLQDAAQTALAAGLAWSLLGVMYNGLQSLFVIKPQPNMIMVIPNFKLENFLRLDYSCIFAFRLGHIIIIIYQLLLRTGEISNMLRRVSQ